MDLDSQNRAWFSSKGPPPQLLAPVDWLRLHPRSRTGTSGPEIASQNITFSNHSHWFRACDLCQSNERVTKELEEPLGRHSLSCSRQTEEGVTLRLLQPFCHHVAVGQEACTKEGRLSNGESSKVKTVCNLSTGEGKVQTEMAEGAKHEGIKGWKGRERGGEPGEGKGG